MSHVEINNFPLQGQSHIPNEIIEYYKITSTGLEAFPVFLKNTININSVNDNLVSAIRFDFINKQLRVVSSTNVPDSTSIYDYFIFNLYNKTDIALYTPIKRVKLTSNMVPTVFLIELDETNFDYEQLIELNYNKVRFKNMDNLTILFIYFDKLEKDVIYIEPYAPGNINKDSDEFYFKILDPLEKITKIQGRINKNQKGDSIKITSDDSNISKNLNIGDILEIGCSQNSLVEIFDFPSKVEVTPISGSSQKFYMDESGLEDYYSRYISSAIVIDGLITGAIVFIKFNIKTKKLEAVLLNDKEPHSATAINEPIGSSGGWSGTSALIFTLKDKNGDALADLLNNKASFEYGDIITLACKDLRKISIENNPTYDENYSPLKVNERFSITETGLVSLIRLLKNEITFLGFSNRLIAKIYFDIDDKKLIVSSSGTTAHSRFGDRQYFKVVLKDSSDNLIKEASVKGNENGNNFVALLNYLDFKDGYTITIIFAERNRVLISNYPKEGNTYNSPDNNAKTFTITSNGLILKA